MNRIDQRLSHLRTHPNLPVLYHSLPFHTRQVIETLLESGATFPLMEKAGQCMYAEFKANPILQILANGDVLQLDSVTELALDELEHILATVDGEEGTYNLE